MRYFFLLISTVAIICLTTLSCKKTSDGEKVPLEENVFTVEITKYERDILSDRLIEKKDTKEFTATDDNAAAKEGLIWYLACIRAFSEINKSSNGKWLSIPKFYSVYDENGHIISRINGEEKQSLIKSALSEEDIQAYKENLPPYHFEYSALMCD